MQDKIDIFGVKVDNLTIEELKEDIIDFATSEVPKTIMYANANSINIAQKNREYKNIINTADIVYPDGQGVVWASRVFGNYLKERMTAADFFYQLCRKIAKKEIKLYLLGSQPGITEEVKKRLAQTFPLLNIVGTYHGYFDKEEEEGIIDTINNCRPNILLVGMGTPKQEEWIYYNRYRLNVSLCWAVGGLFDFISGKIKRAPLWMVHCHLEWLYRLCQEPKRLWRRYLIGNLIFVFLILKEFLKNLYTKKS